MADEITKVAEDSARGGFFLISGTALATGILAIASIMIGRFLGAELYGQYTLALVVPQILFLFTDLGINQGVVTFTANFRIKNEIHRVVRIIKYGLMLRVLTGIAIFAISYIFADFLASFFLQRPELAFYIRIAGISVIFQVVFTTANSAFVGLDKTEYNALTANIQAIAKTAISITLVLLGFSIFGAIVGYVASYLLGAIASIFLLFFVTRKFKDGNDDGKISEDLKSIVHYGIPLYMAILVTGFVPLYQNVVLAIFTTDADVGNYKAATNFNSLITTISVPITTALLPAFSKLHSSTKEKVKVFYRLANKYTAILMVPITVLIIILSREIVEVIYGHTYASAPIFLAIHSLLYFSVGFGYLVLPSLYNGLGETKITLKMSLITFLTLLVLSPIFTKAYSVQGLITAFLIASVGGTFYGFHIARKKFQISVDANTLLKIYLNSALASVPVLLILHFGYLSKLLSIIAGGISYFSLYVTLTPLTKTVTFSELEKATPIIKRTRFLAIVINPILAYQRKLAKMF